MAYSTKEEIDEAHDLLRATFRSGRTKDISWRKQQLKQLLCLVSDNEEAIIGALCADFGRPATETVTGDIAGVKVSIMEILNNLNDWTKKKPVPGVIARIFDCKVRKDPLGVALIFAPWNFPFVLLLGPLASAIGAGCCAVVKPSEISRESANLLANLAPKYLDQTAIRLITGGVEEASHCLNLKFNLVFFTGSVRVAHRVAEAAAKHLTPVVFELGGQCPCIVTKSANLDVAASAIAKIKFLNAGQICLSVNHVFAEPEVADELIKKLIYYNEEFLSRGMDGMSRMISPGHFDRIINLLGNTEGRIVYGASHDKKERFIQPTIVDNIKTNDVLIKEELFGPVLPIIRSSVQSAVEHLRMSPSPLALYLFSEDQKQIDDIIDNTLSGNVTVNECWGTNLIPKAPFGGVEGSGIGTYHGEYGIDAFSHKRTVAQPGTLARWLLSISNPPYHTGGFRKLSSAFPPEIIKRGDTELDYYRLAKLVIAMIIIGMLMVFLAKIGQFPSIRSLLLGLTKCFISIFD